MTVATAIRDGLAVTEETVPWRPDIVLMNVHCVGSRSSACVEELRQRFPRVRVVLTGPEPGAAYARLAAALGADLYLSEGLPPREWLRRLRLVVTQDADEATKGRGNFSWIL
jgi:DNA-binding NarL/FixJ family response regulator